MDTQEQTGGCQGEGPGELGGEGEGTEKHRLVVTEWSQGCEVQPRDHSQ